MYAWLVGLVHFRHPVELGGAYFFCNTITNQLSVFVAAFLYSQYYVPPTAIVDILRAVVNATATNSSASNVSLVNVTTDSVSDTIVSLANDTLTNATQGGSTVGKIDLITLLAAVGTLFAIWALATLGVWLAMKPEYRRTFWSTQTGYAYTQSYFLNNQGNDAKRIVIFSMNEDHWRDLRPQVGQWVLANYSMWHALRPLWFTDAVKAQIPVDFIPPKGALRRDHARASRTVGTGRLRSLSLALGAGSDADTTSVAGGPSPQPIGGEEDDGAAQPNRQPRRAEPAAAASATTNPQDASEIADSDAGGAMAVDFESDCEHDSS
jgi:hypothetical protein